MVVRIPSPMNGYVNLGDCFVLLSGWLLGPWYGGAAAGIGSMLTDLLSGYGYYAPGTFVIKGLDALVAALIFKARAVPVPPPSSAAWWARSSWWWATSAMPVAAGQGHRRRRPHPRQSGAGRHGSGHRLRAAEGHAKDPYCGKNLTVL